MFTTFGRALTQPEAGAAALRCETTQLIVASDRMRLAGDLDNSLRYAQRACHADPCTRPNEGCDRYARIWLALLLTQIRRIERATSILDEVAVEPHNAQVAAAAMIARASVAAADGALDDAASLAGAGLRAAADAGMWAWTPLAHLVLATVALHRGDLPTAAQSAHDLERESESRRSGCPSGQVTWTIMRIEEACNGAAAAAPLAEELLFTRQLTMDLLLAQPAAAPWLVRFALARGERDLAEEGVRLANRLASDNRYFPSVGVAATHAEGLLHADTRLLAIAAENHVDRYARASALEDCGTLQAEDPDERFKAIDSLGRARRRYVKIGAVHDCVRVTQRLRALGAEPGADQTEVNPSRVPAGVLRS